jgi:hypothetical protein
MSIFFSVLLSVCLSVKQSVGLSVFDLFDSGFKDDYLTLTYNTNKNIKMKIKTPYGLTVEKNLNQIVLQGYTWGPIMASNTVDTIGKEILEDDPSFLYKYKGFVPIGICGMMDDVLGVTESGVKSQQMNSFLDVKDNLLQQKSNVKNQVVVWNLLRSKMQVKLFKVNSR